jgi:hypothetical protein
MPTPPPAGKPAAGPRRLRAAAVRAKPAPMSAPCPGSGRDDPLECPHCGDVTMPNRLADGSVVCSCAAEREIPVPRPRLAAGPARPT